MGMNGNVQEWIESAFDGVNDSGTETRVIRGGFWSTPELGLRSSSRSSGGTVVESNFIGFRVASVPEPRSLLLLLCGFLLLRGAFRSR